MAGFIELFGAAEAASLAVCGVGFQASEAVHVSTDHHGRLDHQLEADGAFQLGLVDYGTQLTFCEGLVEFWVNLRLTDDF